MLGPDPPEEQNDEPTSDFGVADSALTTMLGSTDEGSTRSSDSETSGKHGFGESALRDDWHSQSLHVMAHSDVRAKSFVNGASYHYHRAAFYGAGVE